MLARQSDVDDRAQKASLQSANRGETRYGRAGARHVGAAKEASAKRYGPLGAVTAGHKQPVETKSRTLVGQANAAQAPNAAAKDNATQTSNVKAKVNRAPRNANAVPGASAPASAKTAGVSGPVQQAVKKPPVPSAKPIAPKATATAPAVKKTKPVAASPVTRNQTRETSRPTLPNRRPLGPVAQGVSRAGPGGQGAWGVAQDKRSGRGGGSSSPGPVAQAARKRPIPVGSHPQMGVASKPPSGGGGGFKANFTGGFGQTAKSSLMNAFDQIHGELIKELNLAGVKPTKHIIDLRNVQRSNSHRPDRTDIKGPLGGSTQREVIVGAKGNREGTVTNARTQANPGMQRVAGRKADQSRRPISVAMREDFKAKLGSVIKTAATTIQKALPVKKPSIQGMAPGGIRG